MFTGRPKWLCCFEAVREKLVGTRITSASTHDQSGKRLPPLPLRSNRERHFTGWPLTWQLGETSRLVASSDQSKVTIPGPTPIRNNRADLPVLAFGLVVLGLCVFAWGLKYKLSLYDPPRASSHHIAAAKLLPGKERGAASLDAIRKAAGNPVPPGAMGTLVLVLFTLTAAVLRPDFGGWIRGPIPASLASAYPRFAPCFVRPPPRIR
jgi:hypothetical protein